MYVVVFKNDNFRPSVYGPFDDRETATEWGEKESIHEEFWVTPFVTAVPHDAPVCLNHFPVQHRDGKPPWCNDCGLTAGYQKPQSIFSKENNG